MTAAAPCTDPHLLLLQERIRAAVADGARLRICGGGSKAFLAAPAQHGASADVLDATACSGIVSYAPSELVITARAGTPLAEVEAALAACGQHLAFDPPHLAWSGRGTQPTIGGAVASGLGGPARANVGALRDFVLGVQCINGKGERLAFGGQVMKNVAGYDMSRLLAGSWGALALLTEVSLKVLPVAPAEATLRFDAPQQQALDWLHRWGAQPLPLNASCWVEDGGHGWLYLRLRGAAAAVDAASRLLVAQHGGRRLDNAATAPDWARCRDQLLPFFTPPHTQQHASIHPPPHASPRGPHLPAGQAPQAGAQTHLQAGRGLWRFSVPQTAPVLPLPYATLIEWHGAQRWLWAPADTASAQQIRSVAQQAGGHATLWLAPPGHDATAVPRHTPLDAPLARIHAQLKAAFDPHGVFASGTGAS